MRFLHVSDLLRPVRSVMHMYRVLNDPLAICELVGHHGEWDFNTVDATPVVRCSRCPARYTGGKWRHG